MASCQVRTAPEALRGTTLFGRQSRFSANGLYESNSPFAWFGLLGGKMRACVLLVAVLGLGPALLFGKATGSISGTVRDAQGAVVPAAKVMARNVQTGVIQTIATDSSGFYNFPALPIGTYSVRVQKPGFESFQETGLVINVDTALRADATLQVGATRSVVTVTGTPVAVNTRNAQLGQVIGGREIVSLPLANRSFTDLLALQPGVVPDSVVVYSYLYPSGKLDPGVLSMGGGRDVNNGFMINGANTVEGRDGGTAVVPNLDSIAEFRIITSDAGAEYGNYSGGQVNVATKSGTNQFHGDAFEFLRNSDLDSRSFFTKSIGTYRQNVFGGSFGGPILHNKLFFFVDYQGTRLDTPTSTNLIPVPSAADRSGDLSDEASVLAKAAKSDTVDGPFWANTLSNELGYTVKDAEPYYTSGCTTTAECVFPGAVIPQRAFSSVVSHYLPLIPLPNSGAYWQTSAYSQTWQDDKGALRMDYNGGRLGLISGYYLDDPWTIVSPFGASTFPGFPDISEGKSQLAVLGDTKTLNATTVNQLSLSFMRDKQITGLSTGSSVGPSAQSLGFAPAADEGLWQQTQYQNYPQLSFENYTLGPPAGIQQQYDNTYQIQDDFTKIINMHTVKFGADYHLDQVNQGHPLNGSNGSFSFGGQETGLDFADFLLGAPASFSQGAPAYLNVRSWYAGLYGEDSWRATRNLTLSYGVRWEATPYWFNPQNENPDLLAGAQSQLFPTAPTGYVFPGDPGVPEDLANPRYDDFGPRLAVAYAPDFSSGPLHRLFGDSGKSSIRAGYGLYYTNIEGAATFNMASPPYGYFYNSPGQPLLAQPFITRASGQDEGQRFPIPLPPTNVSPGHPYTNVDWAAFEPISEMIDPLPQSKSPYTEDADFSIERQLGSNTLFSVSYVGSFGHHLMDVVENNPGNPALCLSLSQPDEVMPGTPRCGVGGENGVYYPITGGVVDGTRQPFGPDFGSNGYFLDVGNSDYHSLQVAVHHTAGRMQFLASYTYSKAMDNGSAFGDQLLPTNYEAFEGLSLYDMPQNFTFSYSYELPFDKLFRKNNQLTRGWRINGITTFATGVPITIFEAQDRSLMGTGGDSPEASYTDEPDFLGGTILNDTNPRDRKAYFNTSLFTNEPLGQQGTSARRFFTGPGTNNFDLGLVKDVKLTETKTLEFRGEFFNAFNQAQFSNPIGNFNNTASFGKVTGVREPGRIGQIALKFYF
jgi:hypothetical protein